MKILHVYKTFLGDTFGGVEQVIAQIASNSSSSAVSHTVLSLAKAPTQTVPRSITGIENIRLKETCSVASNAISIELFQQYKRLVQDFDVIHYHFPWPFADMLHLFWNIQKPTVLTYHSDIVRQKKTLFLYRPIMQRFLTEMDQIVATSPNYVTSSPVLQQHLNKVKVVPIGLNKHSYVTPSDMCVNHWKTRFGERFFLFVGVLRYYKGLHILLEAAQNTTFPIVLLGSGPEEAALKAKATALGLHNIYFLGQLSDEDKGALLSLCGCMVFPSHLRSEAFGVSLLEAAMFGKPMISAEIGTGTSYINLHGKTGLVVPPKNALALHDAMAFIWNNPVRARTMGEAAFERYEQLFTGAKMATAYEKIYQEVTQSVDKERMK